MTDYGKRPIRWIDAVRKRYTKELTARAEGLRFVRAVGVHSERKAEPGGEGPMRSEGVSSHVFSEDECKEHAQRGGGGLLRHVGSDRPAWRSTSRLSSSCASATTLRCLNSIGQFPSLNASSSVKSPRSYFRSSARSIVTCCRAFLRLRRCHRRRRGRADDVMV